MMLIQNSLKKINKFTNGSFDTIKKVHQKKLKSFSCKKASVYTSSLLNLQSFL